MKEKIILQESVRNLVEFCLKTGDIDNRFAGTSARAVEGTKAHQNLQADNESIYLNYTKEVTLDYEFELENIILKLEGRADGIIIEDDKVIIEEIKSTYRKFSYIDDSNELHWAQAKFYAFIYGKENNIDEIYIRLSYVQLDTYEVRSFERKFTLDELSEFTLSIIKQYEEFSMMIYSEKEKRNESIKKLQFPFSEYREGQRKLVNICYYTIKENEILFAQAPTGIGKTISTIFPSIKAIGEGIGNRIMYLTAKNINRKVALDTFEKMHESGLYFKVITITAKEKICCNNTFDCNPEHCEYAQGYYEKIRHALKDIICNKNFINGDDLAVYAAKYKVCPFELSLDLSLYFDAVICDYNYVFDPKVSLRRFSEEKGSIVLVDEAHNLIDRSREMYSARLNKSQILSCRKLTKGKMNKVSSILGKINSFLIELRNECDERETDWFYEKEMPKQLEKQLRLFLKESEVFLLSGNSFEGYNDLLQLYFDINSFVSTMQLYDENYVTCVKKESKEFTLTLYCVHPAKNLSTYIEKSCSVIFFSATLSPINYYIKMLGGDENSYRVKLPSPFEKENLKVYISPINIRYQYRKRTLPLVLSKICKFVKSQVGNYIVFLPSYEYMNLIWEDINKDDLRDFVIIKQELNMTDIDKEEFLENFKSKRNIIAFCVLGGMFSEGIDLPGEELIGTIIVGVGYPKICMENNIIKEFYSENGFDYAYIYPGINKVEQGAGRVIRTENDKGRILLIDDRYASDKYLRLIPKGWQPIYKF